MVEELIYNILTNAGITSQPTTPADNSALPCVVYTVTSQEPQLHLSGSTMIDADVSIDVYAVNIDDCLSLLRQCNAALHTLVNADIAGSFMMDASTTEEEYGFHGNQTYMVWVR